MAPNDDETSQATNDAYTGMLSISLLALIGGCVLLFLDFQQYPDKNPPKIPDRPPEKKIDAGNPPVPPVQPEDKKAPAEEKKAPDDKKGADDKKAPDEK